MERTEKEIRTAVIDEDRSMTGILEAYLRPFSQESGILILTDVFHDAEAFLDAFAPRHLWPDHPGHPGTGLQLCPADHTSRPCDVCRSAILFMICVKISSIMPVFWSVIFFFVMLFGRAFSQCPANRYPPPGRPEEKGAYHEKTKKSHLPRLRLPFPGADGDVQRDVQRGERLVRQSQ